jgi:hypothetical protein
MGDLLGSLIWGAKSGQYCVIGGESLQSLTISLITLGKDGAILPTGKRVLSLISTSTGPFSTICFNFLFLFLPLPFLTEVAAVSQNMKT